MSDRVGSVGLVVAANIAAARTWAGVSVRELSIRLGQQGRPILPSGITKLEHGTRAVDVDDLVAIACALRVTPQSLLQGPGCFTCRDEPPAGFICASCGLGTLQ